MTIVCSCGFLPSCPLHPTVDATTHAKIEVVDAEPGAHEMGIAEAKRDVASVLRQWLSSAEDGDLIALAVVAERADRRIEVAFGGACSGIERLGMLEVAKHDVFESMKADDGEEE